MRIVPAMFPALAFALTQCESGYHYCSLGFNIGFLANCILRLKLETVPILAAQHDDRVSCCSSSGFSSLAVIFRSNENLMEFAIQGKLRSIMHIILLFIYSVLPVLQN